MKRVLRLAIAAVFALAFVTYVALELSDVAVLSTRTATNSVRHTHVWWVDGENGSLWLEAANPARTWLQELVVNPDVELDRDEDTTTWRAVTVEGDEARQLVRERMAAKYGWADRWVGLFADTSEAVPVRLDPR